MTRRSVPNGLCENCAAAARNPDIGAMAGTLVLAGFALAALGIIEADEDWSADTLDGIASEAVRMGLGQHDEGCRFRRTALGKGEA